MPQAKWKEWATADGAAKIRTMVESGLSDAAIAREIGVDKSLLSVWRRKHPEIRRALYRKKVVDGVAVDAHDTYPAPARKLNNVERVKNIVDHYLNECKENDIPLTKPGLALALGITTERLNMYVNDDSPKNATPACDALTGEAHLITVGDVLKGAMTAVEADLAVRMIARNSAGAMFAAKNWCGYADRQETTVHHDSTAKLTADEIDNRIAALLEKAGN